jgi:hypothetical protein
MARRKGNETVAPAIEEGIGGYEESAAALSRCYAIHMTAREINQL